MRQSYLISFLLTAIVILLVGCSRNGTSTDHTSNTTSTNTTNNIQVALTDYKIAPSTTLFHKGITYHFIVSNNGAQKHEFMIQPPTTDNNMPMQAMDRMALAHITNLDPGQTQTINVTFPQSTFAGKLELACHLAGHYEAGMHTGLTVT